jgi:4'-phosphopantetheinyl transferase
VQLDDNAVHVWTIELDRPASDADYAMLDPKEQQRADQFKFEHHRRRFTQAHAAMRTILAKYVGKTPEGLEFKTKEHGKPFLAEHTLQFNLSHSHERALLGVTLNTDIGIDIEHHSTRDFKNLAKRFFHPDEAAAVSAVTGDKQRNLFFEIWTKKEAYIKAIGTGLNTALDSFCVYPDLQRCALPGSRILSLSRLVPHPETLESGMTVEQYKSSQKKPGIQSQLLPDIARYEAKGTHSQNNNYTAALAVCSIHPTHVISDYHL